MADQEHDNEDRTEEATPERREEYREKGQVAQSRDLSQAFALLAFAIFASFYITHAMKSIERLFVSKLQTISTGRDLSPERFFSLIGNDWISALTIVLPLFAVVALASSASTLMQTRFNWSWEKLTPDFSRMEPFKGIKRMFSVEAAVEALKSSGKVLIISLVMYLILKGEMRHLATLMRSPTSDTMKYFSGIMSQLIWGVVILMAVLAAADTIYNFVSFERRMRMTKQEIKEETKQREADPHVKARLKRMARELLNRKTIQKTKKATVLITNPTHFSIALRYEVGMVAPQVVAKGVDFIALRMREIAKENDIPIVENKPLARSLYAEVKEGEEIPSDLYKAVSEVIRYVFRIKGVKISRAQGN